MYRIDTRERIEWQCWILVYEPMELNLKWLQIILYEYTTFFRVILEISSKQYLHNNIYIGWLKVCLVNPTGLILHIMGNYVCSTAWFLLYEKTLLTQLFRGQVSSNSVNRSFLFVLSVGRPKPADLKQF